MLVGQHFYLHTDHKNLLYILKTETPKVVRWRHRLQEYNFSIIRIPGVKNIIADTQSRQFECEKSSNVKIVNDINKTCTEIVNINSCELYSSREFKYNINAFTRVDIKDSYTEDDKLD